MNLLSKIPKKALIATATAGVAIAVGVAVAIPKEESYRVIQVYEIDGTAQVTREDIGLMDAYVNMQLQSNDQADTGSDSYVQMKMDEDKYLLMEPDTSIRIEATGDSTDSKTKIVLTKGAIVNRIEQKLSEESTYEVETPNSTMAVRGTTFRVVISEPDENGDVYTTLEVYDGSVESVINQENPDGTVTQKKVTVTAGKKILIRGTIADAEYVGEAQDIIYDYDNPVLNFIGYIESEPESTEEKSTSQEEVVSTTEKEETTTKEPKESVEESTPEPVKEEESTTTKEETKTEELPSTTAEPTSSETSSSSSSEDDSSSSSDDNSSSSSSEDNSSSSSEDSSSSSSSGTTSDSTTATSYTVTFTYDGKTFATQTVTANGTAQKPELCPAEFGSWNFDFSTTITADTTIEWKQP